MQTDELINRQITLHITESMGLAEQLTGPKDLFFSQGQYRRTWGVCNMIIPVVRQAFYVVKKGLQHVHHIIIHH